MNVAGSELAGTSLGKAFVQLQKAGDDDEVLITDFADYVNKQQAAFMGARLEKRFRECCRLCGRKTAGRANQCHCAEPQRLGPNR
jgi:hypothetical protein